MVSHPIHDKNGEAYRLDIYGDAQGAEAYLCWQDTPIGRMQWFLDDDNEITLGNIEIFENPLLPRNSLFSRRPFQRPKRSFFRLELGSAMLEFLIAYARECSAVGINGFITSNDFRKNSGLIKWYESYGFTVGAIPEHSTEWKIWIHAQF